MHECCLKVVPDWVAILRKFWAVLSKTYEPFTWLVTRSSVSLQTSTSVEQKMTNQTLDMSRSL